MVANKLNTEEILGFHQEKKLTISKKDLLKVLKASPKAEKNSLPFLSYVFFSVSSGKVTIQSTDLETTLSTDIACKSSGGDWNFTFNFKILEAMCKGRKKDIDIVFSKDCDAQKIVAKVDGVVYTSDDIQEIFPLSNVEDYQTQTIEISAKKLLEALRYTFFAISKEDLRKYLNGLAFEIVNKNGILALRAVATDGHRLAVYDIDVSGMQSLDIEDMKRESHPLIKGIVVPRKSIVTLQKALDILDDAKITISFSTERVTFATSGQTLSIKLIDALMCEYRRAIDKLRPLWQYSVKTNELKEALENAKNSLLDDSKGIRLQFTESSFDIITSSSRYMLSSSRWSGYKPSKIELRLNIGYLLDSIKVIKSEYTIIEGGKPVDKENKFYPEPVILKESSFSDPTPLFETLDNNEKLMLVMPMVR